MTKVFKPGTDVRIVCSPNDYLTATVVSVLVRTHDVRYHVSYWVEKERKEVWLEQHEVEELGHRTEVKQIGFKP